MGFDAGAVAGAIIGNGDPGYDAFTDCYGNPLILPQHHCPHGWVEIDLDGVTCIFDPEYAFRCHDQGQSYELFFRMGEADRLRYGYLASLDESDPTEPQT